MLLGLHRFADHGDHFPPEGDLAVGLVEPFLELLDLFAVLAVRVGRLGLGIAQALGAGLAIAL